MKKVLLICSSDVLGIHALISLKEQNLLAAIAIPETSAFQLIPVFKNFGIDDADVHILTKKNLEAELRTIVDAFRPEAAFVLTFPWKMSAAVLSILPQRFINFHFGLLPKYKGADPIFWQIKNMESKGGISIHIMTEEVDCGPIVLTEELPIIPGETYGLHATRLSQLAAGAALKLAHLLNEGPLALSHLPATPALYFRKPTPEQLVINWQQQTADEIEWLINAANPRYGGAATTLKQTRVNILEAAPADVNNPGNSQFTPGTIVNADLLYGVIVACRDNHFIKINIVHTQQGYLSGFKLFSLGFTAGDVFGE